MSVYPYDPDNWLVSMTRGIEDYINNAFADNLVNVEMSFPDTQGIGKEMPLDKVLIHVEQDDKSSPVIGFGEPGVEVWDNATGKTVLHEAAQHLVNFDVGVWASQEAGGETARMEAVQTLDQLFSSASARLRAKEATGGVEIVSFNGGRNLLDRINDIPVWRAVDMTLVVRVFSRRIPPAPEALVAIDGFKQDQDLTVDGLPAETYDPENPT